MPRYKINEIPEKKLFFIHALVNSTILTYPLNFFHFFVGIKKKALPLQPVFVEI